VTKNDRHNAAFLTTFSAVFSRNFAAQQQNIVGEKLSDNKHIFTKKIRTVQLNITTSFCIAKDWYLTNLQKSSVRSVNISTQGPFLACVATSNGMDGTTPC